MKFLSYLLMTFSLCSLVEHIIKPGALGGVVMAPPPPPPPPPAPAVPPPLPSFVAIPPTSVMAEPREKTTIDLKKEQEENQNHANKKGLENKEKSK